MLPKIGKDSIVVTKESFESKINEEIIYSNISFVNALYEEYFYTNEISKYALCSYYVDYYLAQMDNGGFSQFVYNSAWSSETIQFLTEGLAFIGATHHLEHFKKSASIIEKFTDIEIEKFLESEYFGNNREREILNSFDDTFYSLNDEENLVNLNSQWIRSLNNLVVLSQEELNNEIKYRADKLLDREKRKEDVLNNEPRYMKLIRKLCEVSEQELSHVTAGDPMHIFNGISLLAWHFITDKGHHYMLDLDVKAQMYNGTENILIDEILVEENKYGKYDGVNLKKPWWKFWA